MSRSALPVQDAVSAGGVVWRRTTAGDVEVVLCGRTADRVWGLPKGTPDADEPIEATAIREVQEETGLKVEPGPRLGSIEYWFTSRGVRYHKLVHHWLMQPIGGDLADHDHEFDLVDWFPLGVACQMATYDNERRILTEAARLLGIDLQ